MGIVYLARDVRLDRRVAIKTLPPHLANDPIVRERFLREARTAGGLSHPNIVPIHRADEIAGHVFFVMGFVDGDSMAQRIRALGRLDEREVVRELRDVALRARLRARARRHPPRREGREHSRRTVDRTRARHRLRHRAARRGRAAHRHRPGARHRLLPQPEQVAGEAVDARSDIYSLGVAGFLALSGRFPFDAAARVGRATRARDQDAADRCARSRLSVRTRLAVGGRSLSGQGSGGAIPERRAVRARARRDRRRRCLE